MDVENVLAIGKTQGCCDRDLQEWIRKELKYQQDFIREEEELEWAKVEWDEEMAGHSPALEIFEALDIQQRQGLDQLMKEYIRRELKLAQQTGDHDVSNSLSHREVAAWNCQPDTIPTVDTLEFAKARHGGDGAAPWVKAC